MPLFFYISNIFLGFHKKKKEAKRAIWWRCATIYRLAHLFQSNYRKIDLALTKAADIFPVVITPHTASKCHCRVVQ